MDRDVAALIKAVEGITTQMKQMTRVLESVNNNLVELGKLYKDQVGNVNYGEYLKDRPLGDL